MRPHMVMIVGNRVKGDSRVEKAALSAQRAGYRVTVVGLIHRTVPRLDLLGEIPVFRVSPDYAMYTAWRLKHDDELIEAHEAAKTARKQLRRLRARRGTGMPGDGSHQARLTWRNTLLDLRLTGSDLLARTPVRGTWRRAWPLIADLELAFAQALIDLKPDILHVHDRDPLPGAVTARRVLSQQGHDMKWVYDAHEWLPGVVFTGPRVHRSAWLHAEADLIRHADLVITVSEDRARHLAARHNLPETPTVVTNAPLSTRQPDRQGRHTVRDECGLDPDTALLVYVGRAEARRGLETVVRALPGLPETHLAVVAPPDPKPREALVALAKDLGVSTRLHILDYVAAPSVSWYISSATIGLSPLEHNPAHHQDVATKVREYLHAGLPVVGSDVRAQARFIAETGVGTVHRAGDAEDCARAIDEAIRNRERFRSAITDELLAENSWERQERVLIEAWAGLLEHPPSTAVAHRPSPSLTIGPAVDTDRSWRLLDAIRTATGLSGQVIARGAHPEHPEILPQASDSSSLGLKLDEYRTIVAESDCLLLESLGPLFGGLLGNSEEQLARLAERLRVAVMIDPVAGMETELAIEQVPDSWLLSLAPDRRAAISRQVRRTRRLIDQYDLEVVLTSPLPMPALRRARWLPTVVPIADEIQMGPGPIRVVVAPGPRGGADARTHQLMETLRGPKMTVTMPTSNAELAAALTDCDVLIDSLGHGSYTDHGARALGAGCIVLSRIVEQANANLPPTCPVVNVDPDGIPGVLNDLVSDRERCRQLMSDGLAYARENHDGSRSATIVAEVFGWPVGV